MGMMSTFCGVFMVQCVKLMLKIFELGFLLFDCLVYRQNVTCACSSGAIGSVAVRAAWVRWSASLGSRPGLAGSLCQIIAAYGFRLNYRADTEGSTVSSLVCDRWLLWVQRRSVLVAA